MIGQLQPKLFLPAVLGFFFFLHFWCAVHAHQQVGEGVEEEEETGSSSVTHLHVCLPGR